MSDGQRAPESVDEYIAGFPADVQELLEAIRAVVRAAAPEVQERISCLMLLASYGVRYYGSHLSVAADGTGPGMRAEAAQWRDGPTRRPMPRWPNATTAWR